MSGRRPCHQAGERVGHRGAAASVMTIKVDDEIQYVKGELVEGLTV